MLILNLQLKKMKIIAVFILILSGISFAQSNQNSNLLNLQNSITSNNNYFNAQKIDNVKLSFAPAKKNAGVAILLSFLLPGMGEMYADSYSSGKYFTVAEAGLWGIYLGMNTYSNWQKDRYKSYAASSAGVNNSGKDADFYANVGAYLSIDEYNNSMALEGNFNQMYNTQTHYWNWQTNNDRKAYRSMWTSGEQAHNNLRFVIGALLLNRVISAINAVRLVSAYNKNLSSELGWNVSIGVQNYETLPTQINFNFQTNL